MEIYETHFVFSVDNIYLSIGYNKYGQCGPGEHKNDIIECNNFDNINNSNIEFIVSGQTRTLFVSNIGEIFGIGNNKKSRLGINGNRNICVPHMITVNPYITQIACGACHSLFLCNNTVYILGSIHLWGIFKEYYYTSLTEFYKSDIKISKIACASFLSFIITSDNVLHYLNLRESNKEIAMMDILHNVLDISINKIYVSLKINHNNKIRYINFDAPYIYLSPTTIIDIQQYQQSNLLLVDNIPNTSDFFPISKRDLLYLHDDKLYHHSGNLLFDKQINKIQCVDHFILIISNEHVEVLYYDTIMCKLINMQKTYKINNKFSLVPSIGNVIKKPIVWSITNHKYFNTDDKILINNIFICLHVMYKIHQLKIPRFVIYMIIHFYLN